MTPTPSHVCLSVLNKAHTHKSLLLFFMWFLCPKSEVIQQIHLVWHYQFLYHYIQKLLMFMYSFLFHFQVGEQKEYLIHFREEAHKQEKRSKSLLNIWKKGMRSSSCPSSLLPSSSSPSLALTSTSFTNQKQYIHKPFWNIML